MKALTDKIIDLMVAYKEEHHNEIVKKSVESLIEQIKSLEDEAEFEEVARVVMKHLSNGGRYHFHYTALVTNSTAELVSGVSSVGFL
jgi:methanogenic corrinoid protein MtbC1